MISRRAASCCLALMLAATTGRAQAPPPAPPREGEFSAQRFFPAPGAGHYITVEGARPVPGAGLSLGVFASYAHNPLVLRSCVAPDNCDEPSAQPEWSTPVRIVQHLFTLDLLGGLAVGSRFHAGVRLPLTYMDGHGLNPETGREAAVEGVDAFSPGDPTLTLRLLLAGDAASTLALGIAADVTGGLGARVAPERYVGTSSPIEAGGRVVLDARSGDVGFAMNVGGLWRETARLGNTEIGPEMRYGAALGLGLSRTLQLIVEGFGATSFRERNQRTLEVNGALRFTPVATRLAVAAGGGAGTLRGLGAPALRTYLGATWGATPERAPRTAPAEPTPRKSDEDRVRWDDSSETLEEKRNAPPPAQDPFNTYSTPP